MKPVLALVGRPNVGKSTLFNRLTKSRDAIVADFAGLTRDRHYGNGRLGKHEFIVIDTGGFEPDAASGIFGNADEATGEEALVGRAGSDVGGVGSAKTDGDAESLGATDGDVGAEFAGRGEEKKGEGIGDEDGEGSCFFELKN